MNKTKITNFLRKLRLMQQGDYLNFIYQKFKNRKINKSFREKYPDVILPPEYMIYESFQMNYDNYFNDSLDTAKWLIGYFQKHIELKNVKILEWGCGPARIIRHLPKLLDSGCEIFGSDYNQKTIEWCKQSILGIKFSKNYLQPPLKFQNNFFDVIYATSVFTHLSEEMHYAWMNELKRVCKAKGIIFLTTHGNNCKPKLTDEELKLFEAGNLVVRGNVKEGHRTFAAYQPPEFMRNLFSDVEILEHITHEPEGNYIPQDVWIVRKK